MATAAPVATAVPYVGLRPFEPSERDRFFGRDRDAEVLTDKILSARLTVLYARSGVGKSSLLRALVIPRLEEDGALVVYFDAWAQEDPARALRETVAELATRMGSRETGPGDLTLAGLVERLAGVDGRGLVLVLDQFEEFLVQHAQRLDPLRKELAALLRAQALDATVVLSLREEFLAGLEPFRQEILNLFQSSVRLEGLSPTGLRDAIRRPAEAFGGSCEPAFAERLVHDLRAGGAETAGETVSEAVELPMLQLVCTRAWAQAQREGHGDLTVALYERMGGARRILEDYVEDVMPRRFREQRLTARLMTFLAPPSGLKMSYSLEDLATVTGLAEERIAPEVARLARAGILRTRDYRSGQRYELQHDAFTRVIRPWSAAVTGRLRRRRTVRWILGTAAVVAAVTGGVWYGFYSVSLERADRRREREQADARIQASELERKAATRLAVLAAESERREKEAQTSWMSGGQIEDLKKLSESEQRDLAATRFESVVAYFLWQSKEETRFDRLATLLQDNVKWLPESYGLTPQEDIPWPPPQWPVALHHAPSRALDWGEFVSEWSREARAVARSWGIPVPLRLGTVKDADVPDGSVRLVVAGAKQRPDLPIGSYEDRILVIFDPKDLPVEVRGFYAHFKDLWETIPTKGSSAPYWIVPRWSLPAWKVCGRTGTAGSGATAFQVMNGLLRTDPHPLLSDGAVAYLLDRVAERYPAAAREARRAREGREGGLGDILAAFVLKGHPLIVLPEIFDGIADRWELGPTAIAEEFSTDWMPAPARLPSRLHGPWKDDGDGSPASDEQVEPFRDVGPFLPAVAYPIRIEVGQKFLDAWFPGGSISPELDQAIDGLRRAHYAAHGVWLPGLRFRPAEADTGPSQARIELLGERKGPDGPEAFEIDGEAPLATLMAGLRDALDKTRAYWTTAEGVDAWLAQVPEGVRDWLGETYSVTDVKVLLRGVASPDEDASSRPEATVRYAPWLLSSLVFWATAAGEAKDALDPRALRDRLLETQAARLDAGSGQGRPSPPPKELAAGIRSLAEGDAKAAKEQFSAALKRDRGSAIRAFPAAWVAALPETWVAALRREQPKLASMQLSVPERMDLDEIHRSYPPAQRWGVDVVRLAAASGTPARPVVEDAAQRTALLRDLVSRSGPPESRAPAEAAWVAMEFLRVYDPLHDEEALFEAAAALLTSAIARLEERDAHATFLDLLGVARKTRVDRRIWALVPAAAGAARPSVKYSVALELALALCGRERREALDLALASLASYETLLADPAVSEKDRVWYGNWARYGRAETYQTFARIGDAPRRADAERLYRGLVAREDAGAIVGSAEFGLIALLVDTGRYDEAEARLVAARKAWPDDVSLRAMSLILAFARGDAKSAAALTREIHAQAEGMDKDSDDRKYLLHVAAVGAVATRTDGWEGIARQLLGEGKDNASRDYVGLLLWARLGGRTSEQARTLLEERWQAIDPATWASRLREGDDRAWCEMLAGRARGMKESDRLLDLVESDAAWEQAGLGNLLEPRHACRLDAWFLEALRAEAEGDMTRREDCLRRCVAGKAGGYWVHWMALYLLSQGK